MKMSKAFFKKIKELTAQNCDGKLFIVIDGGRFKEDVVGQKLFVQGENSYYKDDRYKDFWQQALAQVDVNFRDTQIFTMDQEVKIFAEHIKSKPVLVLCGGGHISQFVYQVAHMVGFDVIILDDRKEFAQAERFPNAKQIICAPFERAVTDLDCSSDAYYVVVTRGHLHDGTCLAQILHKPYTYVGMIGSKVKVAITKKHLEEKGYTKEQIASVYSPIGLDLGAETPEEIAVSIMAEIIKVRRSSKGESYIGDEAMNFIATTKEPVVLSMIIEKFGSIPRGAGAKMAVAKSGFQVGTIGGGAIEHESRLKAMEIAGTQTKASIAMYCMDNKDAEKEGMACGGNALLYIEPIN